MFHLADMASWGIALQAGATHVILPSFDPRTVLATIAEHPSTDALLVPTMIQLLIDHPEVSQFDLTSMGGVLYDASPMTRAVLERAMKAVPSASFTQAYGMTELAPVAMLLSPADHEAGHLLSAGRAAPHAEIRIVDPIDAEVPNGTVGEVVVRGGHVMLGYWNKPEETATALRGGWMHTGDGGYLDDQGYLYVVDRIKDMIVTGGENVYSAEVENAVRAHAKSLIAGYKAPRSLEIAGKLPLSSTGKVLKRELRQKHWGDQERQIH